MSSIKKNDTSGPGETGPDIAPSYILTKNHGLQIAGKESVFYAAGTTFDGAKDQALILQLIRSGAPLKEVAVAKPSQPTDAD